jgi:hypothetical protein
LVEINIIIGFLAWIIIIVEMSSGAQKNASVQNFTLPKPFSAIKHSKEGVYWTHLFLK